MRGITVILFCWVLSGCDVHTEVQGGSGFRKSETWEGRKISDQKIQGLINGQSWTAKTARVRFWSSDSNRMLVELFEEVVDDPCPHFATGRKVSLIFTPDEEGYRVSDVMANFNYYDEATGGHFVDVTDQVKLQVDEMTEEMLYGRALAVVDDDTAVNGTFEAHLCLDY